MTRTRSRETGIAPALAGRTVPQFVVFASDDNGYSGSPGSGSSGGLDYVTRLFASRQNPAGETIRGPSTARPSITPSSSILITSPPRARRTPSTSSGPGRRPSTPGTRSASTRIPTLTAVRSRSSSGKREIEKCVDLLSRPWDPDETPERPNPSSGLGVSRPSLIGFRAPFIRTERQRHGRRAPRGLSLRLQHRGRDRGRPKNEPAIGRYPG